MAQNTLKTVEEQTRAKTCDCNRQRCDTQLMCSRRSRPCAAIEKFDWQKCAVVKNAEARENELADNLISMSTRCVPIFWSNWQNVSKTGWCVCLAHLVSIKNAVELGSCEAMKKNRTVFLPWLCILSPNSSRKRSQWPKNSFQSLNCFCVLLSSFPSHSVAPLIRLSRSAPFAFAMKCSH